MIGYETTHLPVNMQSVVFALNIYVIKALVTLIYVIWIKVTKADKKHQKKLWVLIYQLFWDNLLAIFSETLLEFILCGYLQQSNPHHETLVESISFYFGISISSLAIVFWTFANLKVILTEKEHLRGEEFFAVWGSVYSEVRTDSKWKLAFNLIFSLKRALVVWIAFNVQ